MIEALVEDAGLDPGRDEDGRDAEAESVERELLVVGVGRRGGRRLYVVVEAAVLVEEDDEQARGPEVRTSP